ncbi:uncharacterized protein LOC134741840 isoform X2 [Cydia strobilella]|uniref:uncharacterized protein LOC134741840 isoform X2 n=1 Tax=Cydia strobilella TaxID=1100964 RepID=UPI003004B65C
MEIPDVAEDLVKFKEADLVRLHGAYKCMLRRAGALRDKPWQYHCHVVPWHCQGSCQDMRRVVTHMMSCPSDKNCSWPVDCSLLRKEIKRLVSCKEEECPICIQKKEWQISVSAEQRSNLIDLLVQTISNSSSIFYGKRQFSLHQKVLYTKSIEGKIYKKAENLTDYYRMLAAKKWEIKMYLEERERNRQNKRRFQANMDVEERRRTRRGVYSDGFALRPSSQRPDIRGGSLPI